MIFGPPLVPELLLGWRSGRWLGLEEQPGRRWGRGARWGDVFEGVTWLRRKGERVPLPSVARQLSGSLVP